MTMTPTANGHTGTAREQRLAAFGTAEALSALWSIAESLPEQERQVSAAKLAVQLAKESLEQREAELAYEAVRAGKNEQERKTAAESAKGKDEEWVARRERLTEAEQHLAECERTASSGRRLERYWHAFLALRTAQANYLAGDNA